MKYFFYLILLTNISINAKENKTNKSKSIFHKKKIEDARELCLTTLGASISDKDLEKCISNVIRKGKI